MGWYERAVFSRLLDGALDVPGVHALREGVLAAAAGAILEVGPGTGLNLPRYPPSVTRLTAVSRDAALHERAAHRAAERGLAVEHVRADAGRLPLPDGSFDTVVCTFLLCSVPDPTAVARELRRVLRPDGQLLVIEHVAADGARRALQAAMDPLNRLLTVGCRLLRDTRATLRAAGFSVDQLSTADEPSIDLLHRRVLRGTARRA
jgi:ubiquinone/menaquinone biosynthesis C-methylase UbiE